MNPHFNKGDGLTTALRRAGREKFQPDRSRKLREQLPEVMRYFHYARRTELRLLSPD